ncbi:hypothetical protein C2869_04395 [Saccharobesus litoralis]|uniref:Uncharacterized protein n=1 Tax=Saccharobesus litoralis TaxID=2172099 RepID=A0A2S0VNC4_9ALTE|nr:hypothetical protein [Saccharobesus litoralis]AWB65724.1 hypothetical protein C2869_04395 [Saccharobesus litoralis]
MISTEHQQLVARYLNGEKVTQELELACQQNPALIDYIAEHKLIARITRFKQRDHGTSHFVQQFKASADIPKINESPTEQFVNTVTAPPQKLLSNRTASNQTLYNRLFTGTAAGKGAGTGALIAATLLFAILAWVFLPADPQHNVIVNHNGKASSTLNKIEVSESLHTKSYWIKQGQHQLRLDSGARITAHAPTEFNLDKNHSLQLINGQINISLATNTMAHILTKDAQYILANLASQPSAEPVVSTSNIPAFQLTWDGSQPVNISLNHKGNIQYGTFTPKPVIRHLKTTKTKQAQNPNSANSNQSIDLQFDNLHSQVKSAPLPLSNHKNLLKNLNAGFEAGNLNNWKLHFSSVGYAEVQTEAAKSGNYGLYVNTQAGKVTLRFDHHVLPQDFMRNGRLFRLSFDIKLIGKQTENPGIYARLINTKDKLLATAYGAWFRPQAHGNWQRVNKLITGENWPSTHTGIELAFYTPYDEFFIDNVRLEPVVNPKNLLANSNADFESGAYGDYIVEKVATGKDNYAHIEVNKTAAITGDFGMHVDTYQGPLAIKIKHKAFKGITFDQESDYIFSYDLRLVKGRISTQHITSTGWHNAKPGWPPNSFHLEHAKVGESGLIKIRARIPKQFIPDNDSFQIGIHVDTQAVFHLDNFEFFPANQK